MLLRNGTELAWSPGLLGRETELVLHAGDALADGSEEVARTLLAGDRWTPDGAGNWSNDDAIDAALPDGGHEPTHVTAGSRGSIELSGRLPAGWQPPRIAAGSLSLSPVPEGGA